jgi:hypothetical protein
MSIVLSCESDKNVCFDNFTLHVVCALLATTSLSLISVVWNRVDKIWKRVLKIKTEPTSTITNHNLKTHTQEIKTHLMQSFFTSITSLKSDDDLAKLKRMGQSLDVAYPNVHLQKMFEHAIDYVRCARIASQAFTLTLTPDQLEIVAKLVSESMKNVFVDPSQNSAPVVKVFILIGYLVGKGMVQADMDIFTADEYGFTPDEVVTLNALITTTSVPSN